MKPFILLLVCCVVCFSACSGYSAAVQSTAPISSAATATNRPSATFTLVKPTAKLRATRTFTLPAATVQAGGPTETSLPVMDTPPDPLTDTPAPDTAHAAWMDLPVIPTVSDAMRTVYQRGLQKGNNPHAFAKVGDCSTFTKSFLGAFDLTSPTWYRLGPYTDLTGVITQFKGSYERVSVASKMGYNSAAVLSSINSDPKQCIGPETPIACEYRIMKPSLVLVMLGTNDYLMAPAKFEANMRTIIEFWLGKEVVPIISTKADNLEGDNSINAILARLADEYQLPLWNFWQAVQNLPDKGLQVNDPGHLVWGHDYFDDPAQLQNGGQVRNLTALQILDAVWRSLSTP